MSTTSLFVEILIVGILASVWIGIAILSAVGSPSPEAIETMKTLQALLAAVYLACCYALGIVIDRIADFTFSSTRMVGKILGIGFIQRLCSSVSEHGNETVRFKVAINENRATDSLDYLRSRLRISRATTVNAVLLLLVTVGCIFRFGILAALGSPAERILAVSLVGLAVIFASFSTTLMLENSYVLARRRISAEIALQEGSSR